MKVVSIIRQRGQLTIPDSIRESLSWITPLSAVSISVNKPDEIVIRPHQFEQQFDWDKLWEKIKLVRSFKGKGKGSLSQFIAEDRQNRR
jgi:bifunctional DNA-binding transcriptional regulator/antitoxin component of YhaV-PrlF toxin-antitoxin module